MFTKWKIFETVNPEGNGIYPIQTMFYFLNSTFALFSLISDLFTTFKQQIQLNNIFDSDILIKSRNLI